MKNAYCLVLNTCPDEQTAREMAYYLIEQGVAACINIVPQARSIYRWQGRVEEDAEVLLLIKTRGDAYPELERILQSRHPYEVPEIISLPLNGGLSDYLSWLDDSVSFKQ